MALPKRALAMAAVEEVADAGRDHHHDAHGEDPHQGAAPERLGSWTASRMKVAERHAGDAVGFETVAEGPTESPALSPVQSAMTPGLRTSSSLI